MAARSQTPSRARRAWSGGYDLLTHTQKKILPFPHQLPPPALQLGVEPMKTQPSDTQGSPPSSPGAPGGKYDSGRVGPSDGGGSVSGPDAGCSHTQDSNQRPRPASLSTLLPVRPRPRPTRGHYISHMTYVPPRGRPPTAHTPELMTRYRRFCHGGAARPSLRPGRRLRLLYQGCGAEVYCGQPQGRLLGGHYPRSLLG